ncbi:MAG TPA: deoxyribonuclease V [Candidatus Sulfomarinibacteraceae bacterium]|nr:deoxyribonuclease V [Candidatus Sulfomarinibacteraceae bacterium]
MSHSWNVTPAEAVEIQRRLAGAVVRHDELGPVRFVAGVDVGFEQANSVTRAAVVILRFPELTLHEQAVARLPTSFPYIPGLLSFREGPAILEALGKLQQRPDLMLFDGQGLAHPRRLGIASHIGVLVDIPSIGVAKSRLRGRARAPLNSEKGAWELLWDGDEVVGALVRTRSKVKPLYVSIGHRVSLDTAICYVLACTTRYKLPETTRWAHRLASS